MSEDKKAAVRAVETGERKDRVLIVEDEENARKGYEALLQRWGHEVMGVGSAEDALARFAGFQPDILIADVELPGMNGLAMLESLREEIQDVPAIVITGRGTKERKIEAIEAGAYWYLEKPFETAELKALLQRAFEKARSTREIQVLQRQLRQDGRLADLVGKSKPMQDVMRIIEMAAPSSASVLITGETGAGKEIVARTLHKLSPRAGGPFVAINCSAIPESLMESEIFVHERVAFTGAVERRIGCFELADGGTLLLDEIGEMPIATQAKLLRVLEDSKVRRLGSKAEIVTDVRVLAATNKVPEEAVAKGQLRSDLYFRLNVVHIAMPPLREHLEDLESLIERLLEELNQKHQKNVRVVDSEVLDLFRRYSWPGNVRELRNTLERAVVVCSGEVLRRADLAPGFGQTTPAVAEGDLMIRPGLTVAEVERLLIRETLAFTSNNKTRAAEILGISLKTLHNKLKEYESQPQS